MKTVIKQALCFSKLFFFWLLFFFFGGSPSSYKFLDSNVCMLGLLFSFIFYVGHFIQHCPTNGDPNFDIKRVKQPTGIPRSMLMVNPQGSYALPNGSVAVLKPNEWVHLDSACPFCHVEAWNCVSPFPCKQGCFWERNRRVANNTFRWGSTTWAPLPLVQWCDERCCTDKQVLF